LGQQGSLSCFAFGVQVTHIRFLRRTCRSTTFNTIQNSGSSGTNHINAMKVKADNLQTAITNLGT
jgi:hypothetical protein